MSINETLAKYRDLNPLFNDDANIPDAETLKKSLIKIPNMHLSYLTIIANGSINRRASADIQSLKEVVSFGSRCHLQSVIAPLLDPPVKSFQNTDSDLLKALYLDELDGPDINTILDRSDFFHVRDICEKSKDLLAQGSCIVAAHDVMKYALSQDAMIPRTTKVVAKQVLSGEVNPFKRLEKIRPLGRGNYGIVNLVQAKDGHQYAAKTFQNTHGEFNRDDFNHEYKHLTSIDGNHIVRLIHASPPTLFLEFVENGTLTNDLPPEKVLKALSQIAMTLSNMHEKQKIIHGDLKFSNILIDKKEDIKIADLGLAFFKHEFAEYIQKMDSSEYIPYYLPPDLKQGTLTPENCEKIDVWSFGILIWKFLKKDDCDSPIKSLTWEKPFHGFEESDLMSQLNPEKIRSIDPEGSLITFMQQCLEVNPNHRPSMEDISHYFLRIAALPDRDSAINSVPLPSIAPSPAFNISSIEAITEEL